MTTGVAMELVRLPAGSAALEADLAIPPNARGLVVFAHGSGSGRHSPRNRYVASVLQDAGLGTLLLDLLTPREEAADRQTGVFRFDIRLLASRLLDSLDDCRRDARLRELPVGFFGASTGAAAALLAAAARPDGLRAVVSRGGRPDLAGGALPRVFVPTLLVVGGNDAEVLALNREALSRIAATQKQLRIVPRASHLFPEPGALEEVSRLAAEWFHMHLVGEHPAAHAV